jgi:hypothetical protein
MKVEPTSTAGQYFAITWIVAFCSCVCCGCYAYCAYLCCLAVIVSFLSVSYKSITMTKRERLVWAKLLDP